MTSCFNQKDILQIIEQSLLHHLDNHQYELNDLCKEVGYSYPHLYRMVKTKTGRSLAIYVRYRRLELSLSVLSNSDYTVAQAAHSVGLSPNYYARAFRQEYGLSPKEWRMKS